MNSSERQRTVPVERLQITLIFQDNKLLSSVLSCDSRLGTGGTENFNKNNLPGGFQNKRIQSNNEIKNMWPFPVLKSAAGEVSGTLSPPAESGGTRAGDREQGLTLSCFFVGDGGGT